MEQPSSNPQRSTAANTEPLGGADAIIKTTYVVGQGTDPNAMNREGNVPPVSGSRFGSPVLWIALLVALGIVIAYLAGYLN